MGDPILIQIGHLLALNSGKIQKKKQGNKANLSLMFEEKTRKAMAIFQGTDDENPCKRTLVFIGMIQGFPNPNQVENHPFFDKKMERIRLPDRSLLPSLNTCTRHMLIGWALVLEAGLKA